MEPKVCVLSSLEARELVESGTVPDCSKHRHIKSSEAREMTGDCESRIYFRPVARWVGKDGRRIQMLEDLQCWSRYSGHCRMNGWALMRRVPLTEKEKRCETRAKGA
jgi:hypothetical protein